MTDRFRTCLQKLCILACGTLLILAAPAYAASSPSRSSSPSTPKTSSTTSVTKAPVKTSTSASKKTTTKKKPARRRAAPRKPVVVNLVWHVETLEGKVLESSLADNPINPASVIKVATSLWALETLGPSHRFETRFLSIASPDQDGTLHGDLFVEGARDPDFQPENAFLVAAELNRRGVRRVSGALVVDQNFWIGYEGGSERRLADRVQRTLLMGQRLLMAFDPARWSKSHQRSWHETALRHGLDPNQPPRVQFDGAPQAAVSPPAGNLLARHVSRPLLEVLHAFNAWSNNDMERVGDSLGSAGELARWLSQRWSVPTGTILFETTSGLGTNRLTPRLLVQLVRDLNATCQRLGLAIDDVLPSAGCVPGTVSSIYQTLANSSPGSVVGKTGTLTATDGGVTVFAGLANTAQGPIVFSVAAPNAAGKLRTARSRQQQWILDMAARHGGLVPTLCGPMLTPPDSGAEVASTTRTSALR